jgi:hypothetical protein
MRLEITQTVMRRRDHVDRIQGVKEQRSNTHRDLRTREARRSIKTNAIAAGTAVHLDLAGIGLEVLCGVFCRDTALDGEAAFGDGFLGETELGERRACCDLDLRGDNVDAGDFLYVTYVIS